MEGVNTHMISLYTKLQLVLARLFDDEEGQGLTEYALILALIAVVAIAALTLLGGKITSVLSTVASSI
jgi:pilus assembly protein Flp/PilA